MVPPKRLPQNPHNNKFLSLSEITLTCYIRIVKMLEMTHVIILTTIRIGSALFSTRIVHFLFIPLF